MSEARFKIKSDLCFRNTNILAQEGIFYDYPFLSNCGYQNPDRNRHKQIEQIILENNIIHILDISKC